VHAQFVRVLALRTAAEQGSEVGRSISGQIFERRITASHEKIAALASRQDASFLKMFLDNLYGDLVFAVVERFEDAMRVSARGGRSGGFEGELFGGAHAFVFLSGRLL
jgi:hypothetical protein